ncbi:MAG: HAD family hydrolase [Nitrospirae bacterium]|nr:MAG: HAD family hydrolase [Nitrospirota bacterium]
MSHPIQAILFDGVGTLFRPRGSVGEVYHAVAAQHRPDLTPEELEAAFREELATAEPMAFPGLSPEHLKAMELQWWYDRVYRIFARFDILLDFETYRDQIYEAFRGPAWVPYPETRDTLVQLRERGLTVAVLSNFDSRLPEVLDHLGLTPLVDHAVYASPHGVAKPDPRLFAIALERCGVGPEAAVHVGDELGDDVSGARAAGIRPVLVDRDRRRLSTVELPVIHRLDELLPLLERL